MIRKLTVENFFSIREPQTLDLSIAKNATDPDGRFARPIPSSPERFPKVVAIFGANASGKTNLLRAAFFVLNFVRNSASSAPDATIPFLSFQSEEGLASLTKFSLDIDGALLDWPARVRFTYELAGTISAVLEETLCYYPKGRRRLLFRRQGNTIHAGADFCLPKRDPVRGKVRRNASVISVLAQFNHDFSVGVYNALSTIQTNVTILGKSDFPQELASDYYEKIPAALADLVTNIKKLDLGIERVELVRENDGVAPQFFHRGLNAPINLSFESQGTRRFYSEFPKLFYVLSVGSVAIIDELDNDVHPMVLPEIVRLFQNPKTNPYGAQLIMSCHNATLLEHLEKEEVYFTEKDASGATEVYGLKDIQGVRRDTNIYAKYLAGAYGAVPRVA